MESSHRSSPTATADASSSPTVAKNFSPTASGTANQGYRSYKWTNLDDNGNQACTTDIGVNTDFPCIPPLRNIPLTAAEAVLRGATGMSRAEALSLSTKSAHAYGDDSGKVSDAQFNLEFLLDERARELYHELHRRTDLVRYDRFTTSSYIWQWKGGVIDGRAVKPPLQHLSYPHDRTLGKPQPQKRALLIPYRHETT